MAYDVELADVTPAAAKGRLDFGYRADPEPVGK
jgi:hypothetical protein